MTDNKTKTDRIHDQLPKIFNTRVNPNWKAIVEAIGESDQNLADLIKDVRKQFFVKTASRPYIDRLGSNFKVSRPRLVGMDDTSFRDYIPVLAYQPKQVKLVMDKLLDIFFFKESTTAFIQSTNSEPFDLSDTWGLDFTVDSTYSEKITFLDEHFTDIGAATAEEIVNTYNRQAQHTFAIVFDDKIRQQKYIRIFTNTVGSKGSLEITGGLANKALQFSGYNSTSGSGLDTSWNISKVGNTMTFTHDSGATPHISKLQVGDVVITNIPNNSGSFEIASVDAGAGSFSFVNVFGSEGAHDHTGQDTFVNFLTPVKTVIYNKNNRAVVWEVKPGEIIIEMPASPPVVKRDLKGSAHINGLASTMSSRDSDTSMTIDDATDWPDSGQFVLQEKQAITSRISTPNLEEEIVSTMSTRFNKANRYTYAGKTGNQITGITPDLPSTTTNYQVDIVSCTRTGANTITCTTATDHNFTVGEGVHIQDTIIGIQVDILAADTATQVASKTQAAIDALDPFSATYTLGDTFVDITTTDNGTTTDAADVDAGVSISVTQQGDSSLPEITRATCPAASTLDVSGNGLHWTLWSGGDENSYYIWYNVTDGANTQENPKLATSADGTWTIHTIPAANQFVFTSIGDNGTSTGGTARVERIAMADSESIVYSTSARLDTGIYGPYMWDLEAPYVLSSLTSTIQVPISSGENVRTLEINAGNNIPDEEGYVIFDFGTEYEEGPIRYLYKPSENTIQMDPAYIFQYNHSIGSAITVIRRRGPIKMSGQGTELGAYITDPAVARTVLQDLMKEVKSVGIFLEFLIRYPEQLYSVLDVYDSGSESLWPIEST